MKCDIETLLSKLLNSYMFTMIIGLPGPFVKEIFMEAEHFIKLCLNRPDSVDWPRPPML
ncbi:hypothetical protein HMPREF0372_01643 [Flavonifractor plautii ATCC 29863]|uniref:Uncharacterized protein n=1 Tax=Flavonifractor plautii ATCC 29863 TaxID=411475 RepID=G9YQ51_FLAPL|nr:hypothetical protein HMPREF0372_01643 [Flavonifractor plautii ATCC 29863]